MRIRCAAWGGVSLGIGTLAYALCSSSSIGCSTNLVVLTHGTVTARGCAAYSTIARLGVGLMVLGAVLLVGSFIAGVRIRQSPPVQTGVPAPVRRTAPDPRVGGDTRMAAPAVQNSGVPGGADEPAEGPAQRRTPARVGPVPPGTDQPERTGPSPESPIRLPPGWYGNPNNPERPVQWWDGRKLVDRPSRPGR